ncbi:hypothetical protein F4777DRAFT_491585 [Nemania sp. FL0916]|nr:hypothetical protein F4777DRAFT_491585 [Nemania sp. FL0916]
MILHELYPCLNEQAPNSGEIHADIVMVHGLQGHHINTWKAEDNTIWPTDLLPRFLCNTGIHGAIRVRVLSFEYGGTIRGTTSKAGIDDVAQNMLELLLDKRDDRRSMCRPIIFVAHSLGGVIVKRAIRLAYNDWAFNSIRNATIGIIFFATPNQGDRDEFRTFLSNVLKCNGPKITMWRVKLVPPSNGMLEEIRKDAGLFTVISKDFIQLSDNLTLHAFLEEHKVELLGKVVLEKFQADINNVSMMISGDHLSLCKFKRDEEDIFSVVWKRIGEMVVESPQKKELIEKRRKALDSLCPISFCQPMATKKPMGSTGEWVFKIREFENWKTQSGMSKLWISGAPGCGKSYLATHIIHRFRTEDQPVVAAFMHEPHPKNIDIRQLMSNIIEQALVIEPRLFNQIISHEGSVKDLLQKALNRVKARELLPNQIPHLTENNLQGLFAATLRQVLDSERDLIDEFIIPNLDFESRHVWTLDALKELWLKTMTKTIARHPVVVVIDGFDTMKRQCQEDFLGILESFSTSSPTAHCLRILVVSNEYPDLESDSKRHGFSRYALRCEDIEKDISTDLDNRMETLNKIHDYTPELKVKIKEEVPKKAAGMYLRANLMLEGLKRTKYSPKVLLELLASDSNSTEELYDHFLGTIWANETTSRSIKQVLSWVVFQLEGLSPEELSIARALAKARDNIRGRDISYEEVYEYLDENTELWVNRFCGHLVQLQNGRYELIHPSLGKYLTTRPDQIHEEYGDNTELHYHAESYMDPAENHRILGNLCATYLALPFFAQSARSECPNWFSWQAAVYERMKKHKFLRYAALYWSEHLKLARDLAMHRYKTRELAIERKRQDMLENWDSWEEVGCYFHDWHGDHDYPDLCSALDKIVHKPLVVKPIIEEDARSVRASTIQPEGQLIIELSKPGIGTGESIMPDIRISEEPPTTRMVQSNMSEEQRRKEKQRESWRQEERQWEERRQEEQRKEDERRKEQRREEQRREEQRRQEQRREEQSRERRSRETHSIFRSLPLRRPHVLVRVAQKVVDRLGLDDEPATQHG